MRFVHRYSAFVAALALTFGLCVSDTAAKTIRLQPGENDHEALQSALILAEPGDVISLTAGIFNVSDGLSLDVDNVTIAGAGPDKTILSFAEQETGGEGLLVTSDKIVLRDFAVIDAKGDAIKSKGSDRISFLNLKTAWSAGPNEANGAYGLYPVDSKNVLIDGVEAYGASDAGIYVGQSENIIVRNSLAHYNVAGIEIENSYYADVYNNEATHNTGGILIFDLPDLPQQGGHHVRVFRNKVLDNDTPNFAPEGNIVGAVPKGTGIMVMANRDVEVFDNDIGGNGTVNVLVASYIDDFDDKSYQPHPARIHVHGNRFGPGGFEPDNEIGELIASISGTPIPDIVFDGRRRRSGGFLGGGEKNRHSFHSNGEASFANLRIVRSTLLPWFNHMSQNASKYDEPLDPLKPVELPQEAALSKQVDVRN